MPTFQNLSPGSSFNFPDPFTMPALANAMRFKTMFSAMAPAGTFGGPAAMGGPDGAGANSSGPPGGAQTPVKPQKPPPVNAPAGADQGVEAQAPGMIADPYGPPQTPMMDPTDIGEGFGKQNPGAEGGGNTFDPKTGTGYATPTNSRPFRQVA